MKKKHIIISLDAKKPVEKNPTLFHDKILGGIKDTRLTPKNNKGSTQQANSQHQIKW